MFAQKTDYKNSKTYPITTSVNKYGHEIICWDGLHEIYLDLPEILKPGKMKAFVRLMCALKNPPPDMIKDNTHFYTYSHPIISYKFEEKIFRIESGGNHPILRDYAEKEFAGVFDLWKLKKEFGMN